MQQFTPSLSKRREILDGIRRKHPKWKTKKILSWILKIIAAGIMIGIIWLLIAQPEDLEGTLILLIGALIIAFVPFVLSIAVTNNAKYNCALPYSSYANATLLLYEDKMEYIFWIVGDGDPGAYSSKRQKYLDENKFTYSIQRENLKSLEIKDQTCFLKGEADLQMPDWSYEIFSLREAFPEVVEDKKFSFILAFQEENAKEKILEWYKS